MIDWWTPSTTRACNCNLPVRSEFQQRSTSVVYLTPIGIRQQPHYRSHGVSKFRLRTVELLAPIAQVSSRPGIVRPVLSPVDSRVVLHRPSVPRLTTAAKPLEVGAALSIRFDSVVRIARAPCWKA